MWWMATVALGETPATEYAERHLKCWSETRYGEVNRMVQGEVVTRGSNYEVWGVNTGLGRRVEGIEFAKLTGDTPTVAALQRNSVLLKSYNRSFVYGGLAATGASLLTLAVGSFIDSDAVRVAGATGGVVGGSLLFLTFQTNKKAREKLSDVSTVYDYDDAVQRCDAYNTQLRRELGPSRVETVELTDSSK